MRRASTLVTAGILLSTAAGSVFSQTLPRSGIFAMFTAFKGSGELHQVSESRIYSVGTWRGISYSAQGTGLFHAAPVVCVGHADMVNGGGPARGLCTFSDGADKVHGEWTGRVSPDAPYSGSGRFIGGTGKFVGISGGWSFSCVPVKLDADQWTCDQKVEYRLP